MILSVEKLSHSYGVRTLFKDVTFNIEMGDKIGIIGVNGTGKSTLLRDIARGEAGDGGRITANGSCVIEYLPQNPDHDPQATVLEQVFQEIRRSWNYCGVMNGRQRWRLLILRTVRYRAGCWNCSSKWTAHMPGSWRAKLKRCLISWGSVILISRWRNFPAGSASV